MQSTGDSKTRLRTSFLTNHLYQHRRAGWGKQQEHYDHRRNYGERLTSLVSAVNVVHS